MEFTLMFGENIQEPDQIYEYSLEKLFSFMRYSEKLEWLIEDIRAAHRIGEKNTKSDLKKQLQYIITSHLKEPRRHKDNFLCSNGFIFDADHLVDVTKMVEILKTNKYVHFMFLSPSGDGLKIGVKTSVMIDNADWYSSAYRYCSHQITKTYGITLDKTSDCVRACFLSHDDDIYYNPNSALWFPKILKEQPKPEYKPIIMSEVDEISRCIDAARSITVSDYQEWVTCMFALKNTFGEAGFDVFRALSFGKGYKDSENDLQYKWRTIPGDSQVNIGSFWHIAKKYGYSYK